jgi:alkylhydroperoxidase/carboxymuconolactone decarboxylase family protein YurZ
MTQLPPSGAGVFATQFPDAWDAYQALGRACSESGPLDARDRRLIKLALSIGVRSEGAVHSHARQGAEEGLAPEELRQVAALAITTLGFPAAMAGLCWVNDILKDKGK